ncbi:MAG: hypothetical protein GX808_12175 [Syntrophomonadaceae bacterium]|nr:hypothetical protein [Syntrophomonadaceae bacterium]
MFRVLKKEYITIAVVIIITAVIGLIVRFSQPGIEIVYPEKETVLAAEDFVIETDEGDIIIGDSSWDQVTAIFPDGEMLGLSTIYRPAGSYCLFQFTEDENILTRMHIDTDYFTTSRGVKVGDPVSALEKQYGPDYATVKSKDRTDYFEMIYGGENNIVFQIQNNKVAKIILQHEISL